MAQFDTPQMETTLKLTVENSEAQELMIDHATRNGKYVKEQMARKIWQKHNLPMYRGTIVDEVPFQLKIDKMLFNYKEYRITAEYRFIAL